MSDVGHYLALLPKVPNNELLDWRLRKGKYQLSPNHLNPLYLSCDRYRTGEAWQAYTRVQIIPWYRILLRGDIVNDLYNWALIIEISPRVA
ncbi:hypothetical protein ACFLUJ_07335 [Chloroflexota bacterium]